MSDLTDFLLARIAEDEAAILDGWDSDGNARVATMWTGGEPGYTTVASDSGDDVWVADGRDVDDARHIQILFDPAQVLAECRSKRQIVGLVDSDELFDGDILRALALPYADHADYREEWRP